MADDVTLPGTGVVVRSDDVGGVQVQYVKMDLGASGASSPLIRGQDTAANGIPIAPPNDDFVTVQTTITRPADTTAYAANDALANSTSAPTTGGFTLSSVARASGGSGIIIDAVLTMSTAPATALIGEIWLFNEAVTAINDNAAWAISDADVLKLVGIIPFTTIKSGGNNLVAHVPNLNYGFTCVGSANLRFLVKVLNAYTPASAEVLSLMVKISRMT